MRIQNHLRKRSGGFEFEIHPMEIKSAVPAQPIDFHQTVTGAKHRAREACLQLDTATIGIGIESGLIPIDVTKTYFDPPCIMIYERKSAHFFPAFGAFFPIPTGVVKGIRERGSELGYEVQNRAQGGEKDPHAWFSDGLVNRDEIVRDAILCAMTPLLYPERNQ